MVPQPLTDVVTLGPEGLAEDLPCPKCEYNLRGLTVPRCPECGYAFAWQDVPRLLEARQTVGGELGSLLILLTGVCLLIAFLAILTTGEPIAALAFVLPILMPFAISGVQAALEILVGWPLVGSVSGKRFRAWWEGVLIGYGLCATTCWLVSRPMIVLPGSELGLFAGQFSTPLLLLITAVESFLVQWWVVRRRARQWNEPVPTGRLALACLAAKAFAAIPWCLIATGILAR